MDNLTIPAEMERVIESGKGGLMGYWEFSAAANAPGIKEIFLVFCQSFPWLIPASLTILDDLEGATQADFENDMPAIEVYLQQFSHVTSLECTFSSKLLAGASPAYLKEVAYFMAEYTDTGMLGGFFELNKNYFSNRWWYFDRSDNREKWIIMPKEAAHNRDMVGKAIATFLHTSKMEMGSFYSEVLNGVTAAGFDPDCDYKGFD
jgi:hypothetical protein